MTTPVTRSARVRAAVLDATAALLAEGGLPAATVDAINARSGVSKATIYKHWANRTAVAIDAFAAMMAETVPLPDTGSARGDLTEQARRVAAFYASPAGRIFAQLLAQTSSDPLAARLLRERFLNGRQEAVRVLWQRGLDRGQVRPDIDPQVAIDVLFGPIVFRMLTGHAPIDPPQAAQIAEAALTSLLT
ncbi:TetR/AcrR family transcriptional regulator [Actinacidiphila guanduensis]|uniref:Transcriptional regulator, TetR family n=1 Tax=Actinacidiphila guanduensis TaxID=310781 RepID=A0A1H0I301_9ACTN|nr:TetR/AcrR family transcriptional regulator [Actinacidiphila guanduensis]SDO25769.1 transcriptional regulator, TetR family [Actinacidiphila guanduensis]